MKYCLENSIEDRTRNIIADFSPKEEYIVYGTGECFQFMQWIFGDLLKIKFCIDKKADSGTYEISGGYKVYSPQKLQDYKDSKVIIAANGEYYFEIKENLMNMGYKEELLCSAFEIAAIWGMEYKQLTVSMYVSFPILSACTLNCSGCIHYTAYHKKGFLLKKEDIIKSIDLYFKCIDLVDQIQIFGGEPFLHKNVGEICEYISEHYADRYHKMLVTTNGTIIPCTRDIERFKKCSNFTISISDYSQTNEERLKIDQLVKVCKDNQIDYIVNSNFYRSDTENLWFDCGDPTERKEDMDAGKRFFNCTLSGSGVFKNRYFYCPNSMFANITDIYPDGNDYLDLEEISLLAEEERNCMLQEWHLGFLEHGKLDFCSYCNGFGKKVNSKYIKAGVQL